MRLIRIEGVMPEEKSLKRSENLKRLLAPLIRLSKYLDAGEK